MRVTRLKNAARPQGRRSRARAESASGRNRDPAARTRTLDADAGPPSRPGEAFARVRKIAHHGAVNRVRVARRASGGAALAATWSEAGIVQVWDLSPQPRSRGAERTGRRRRARAGAAGRARAAFSGHRDEGYAVDWSEQRRGGW